MPPSRIAAMFDRIAFRYDFLNHFLSFGLDIWWRKRAASALNPYRPKRILDVATGTGDLAIACARLHPQRIIGVDFSKNMLDLADRKVNAHGLTNLITLECADVSTLRFKKGSFDAITVGFGVRNFANLDKSLQELNRVLKKKGHFLVLELSRPTLFPFSALYGIYAQYIVPFVGGLLSSRSAYSYLHQSSRQFMAGKTFIDKVESFGFSLVKYELLSFGICRLYLFRKQ